jgi:predicted DCC family thiol-disulfide oxidoreductase YuxK
LCHWSVRFVLKHDKKGIFSFAAFQSETAEKNIPHINGQDIKCDTVVYQKADRWFIKSGAVLEILDDLGGMWRISRLFKVLPKSFLDQLYDVIARNRYGWFGKKDKCAFPTPETRSRFLK